MFTGFEPARSLLTATILTKICNRNRTFVNKWDQRESDPRFYKLKVCCKANICYSPKITSYRGEARTHNGVINPVA